MPRDVCAICLDELALQQGIATPVCKHSFHGTCLEEWLRRSQQCPLCRNRLHTVKVTANLAPRCGGRCSVQFAVCVDPVTDCVTVDVATHSHRVQLDSGRICFGAAVLQQGIDVMCERLPLVGCTEKQIDRVTLQMTRAWNLRSCGGERPGTDIFLAFCVAALLLCATGLQLLGSE